MNIRPTMIVALTALACACPFGFQGPVQASAAPATTNLLFPVVIAGSSTGVSSFIFISNMSKHLGAMPESGDCTLTFSGNDGSVAAKPKPLTINSLTTAMIDAGQNVLTKISAVAPRFFGYVIATCNFASAEGALLLQNSVTTDISRSS